MAGNHLNKTADGTEISMFAPTKIMSENETSHLQSGAQTWWLGLVKMSAAITVAPSCMPKQKIKLFSGFNEVLAHMANWLIICILKVWNRFA